MDDDDAAKIAKHFFLQFLQLKADLQSGAATRPRNWDKELAGYKTANEALRKAASDLAEENKRLEEALSIAEEKEQNLRAKINELTINLGLAREKLQGLGHAREQVKQVGYNLMELMNEDSKREFEKLMKDIPYGGTKDE